MNETTKNPNVPRQETHSEEANTSGFIIRILDGLLKLYRLGERILEELRNIAGAINRQAEAAEEGNKYLRNISDTCDEWKAHQIDDLDFHARVLEEVHGIHGDTSIIKAEVIRIKNGLKNGKYEI